MQNQNAGRLALDPIPHRLLVQRPSYRRCHGVQAAQGAWGSGRSGWEMPTASHAAPAAPAREVLVARQPVLDAEMNLLGFDLLVYGAAVVADALSEIGLEQLTGGHAAWLPLGRELLLDVGPVPVRSDRVVLQVRADAGADGALQEAVRQLAAQGACIALDDVTYRPALEPLLDCAWGVKLDLAAHGADGLHAQVAGLAGRDLVLI